MHVANKYTRYFFVSPLGFSLLIAMLVFGVLPKHAAADQPNFIIILTDDQGYGDLGCYGSTQALTPRIDQMAKEGARLTSFYMTGSCCTPSRASLMTGSYAKRIGMAGGVCLAVDPKGLHPDEITIAEVLKKAGYATGIFGKWHLGDQPKFLPTRQGFDEFFGLPYSHDIHPHHPNNKKHNFPSLPLLEGEAVIELEPNADLLTKRFTERAVVFIQENKDKPFFLYVPHPIPHRPLHMMPPIWKVFPMKCSKRSNRKRWTTRLTIPFVTRFTTDRCARSIGPLDRSLMH